MTFPEAEWFVSTETLLSQTLEVDWAAGLCLEGYGSNTAHYTRLDLNSFNWKTSDHNLSSSA